MSTGLSSAAIGGIVGGVGSVVGGLIGANGAQSAADTQAGAAQAGIAEQQREFDTLRNLLQPYVDQGTGAMPQLQGITKQEQGVATQTQGILDNYLGALTQLNNMTGVNGADKQQGWINSLTQNPLYTNAMNLGQQAILANASATGGLRGGNTIASLGYLPGQILSNVMGQQISNQQASLSGINGALNGSQVLNGIYGQLGGQFQNLINTGANAAAGTGNAAIATGNNITNLTGQIGSAQAGGTLGTTNAITGGLNNLTSALGNYLGSSGSSGGGYSFSLPAYLNAAGAGSSSPGGLYGTGAGMF